MKRTCMAWALAACTFSVSAQTAGTVELKRYQYEDGGLISQMSDNGLWAVASTAQAENPILQTGARIINLKTQESKLLVEGLNTDTVLSNSVNDVTNNGEIAVGELNCKPAYYSTVTGKWKFLELKGTADQGVAKAVTPDGKYAVGILNYSDAGKLYEEVEALWDLSTGKLIPTPGVPTKDMSHEQMNMNRFLGISPDGVKILGCMSYSYLPAGDDLGGIFFYIYDTKKKSYTPIGFDETETGRWKPHADGLYYISNAFISNNGKWVTGGAYMVKQVSGSDFPTEYEIPFRYDVENNVFTAYDDTESNDKYGWVVDNDGNVYAAGPAASPYREFGVRSGKYWVDFAQTLKQHYKVDLQNSYGIDISGSICSISDDGKTILSTIDPHEGFVVTTPERFSDIASNINLLSAYSVAPKNGASISKISSITLSFTRDVQVVGNASDIIVQEVFSGKTIASAVSFKADGKTATIVFRGAKLPNEGEPYYVIIPAKSICLAADASRYNDRIRLNYSARAEAPVKVVKVSPKDNSTIGKLDAATSPITLTFDTDLSVLEPNARGKIYQEGATTPFADLMFSCADNTVLAYPASTQHLYKDVNYRIEFPAGMFADVSGNKNTANEAFTVNYKGAYEREISYDENVLFQSDFEQGVNGWLVLDNDRLNPSEASKAIGFTENYYGWVPAWDENNTENKAVASTSMYSPAGKSDDWLVIPQVKIVDKLCSLSFLSQSYHSNAKDRLKVYVWESNEMFNSLEAATVEKIRTEGKLVYDELQSPGKDENTLAGDWKENNISLKEFEGKNVYIAFLNDNENQSAVFLDDVRIIHELPFYVGLANDETVVDEKEITIKGVVDIRDKQQTFTTAHLVLKTAEGKTVDEINASGLSLKAGDKYKFEFAKKLPLQVGEVNDFSVDIRFNDIENTITKSVKSLAFQPVKRVVLEEMTGTKCTNCPLGMAAIDKIHDTYGELFIPMALHCYNGDPFMVGVTPYAAFLGLTTAPSGIIQRSGTISNPMVDNKGDYGFNAPEGSGVQPLWLDLVTTELNKPAEAEITATASLSSDGLSYTVPVNVRYALNAQDVNHKIFTVVLENNLQSLQFNGFSSVTDPDLGEWGKGGKYGFSTVNPFYFDHVVRGYHGTSFTGVAELLPTEVKAGETYTATINFNVPAPVSKAHNTDIVVMLFDGNTDKLINAYQTKVSVPEGIEDATGNEPAAIRVTAARGEVIAHTAAEASVEVYTVDGRHVARAQGKGAIRVAVPAYKGVAIVRVATAQGNTVKKVIL